MTKRCAVLGSPVSHSLSPALHRAAYAQLGLDWSYDAFKVEAAELAGFVAGLDESWRGLSLTMPLKEAVVPLGEPDEVVRELGVGNTLVIDGDRRTVHNTDVGGLVAALQAAGLDRVERVALLGNGATARSALVAVARLACHQVDVYAREPRKTAVLAEIGTRHGVAVTARAWGSEPTSADLLVSTVPAAVAEEVAESLVRAVGAVFDVVYDPWPTPMAARALAARLPVVSGLDLLAYQAVEQVRLMTGRQIDAEVLLSAGRAELSRRAGA